MDSQPDNFISELQQGKVEPSECWQAGEKEREENGGGSLPHPYAHLRPNLVGAGSQGFPVVRSPKDLRFHPALLELDGMEEVFELNEAERVRQATMPILISSDGAVLAGFGHWRSALLHGEREVQCIEYVLGQEDALKFILAQHGPRRAWNAFVRTRLALTLEPYFQRRSLDNMRNGGKHKGSARLPNPQRIDVRRQIAEMAGVGARNVSNVKIILAAAHKCLLTALANGTLTINKALGLCKLPRADQLDAFTQLIEERAIDKVIRRALTGAGKQAPCLESTSMLNAFQLCETRHPGSVVVRRGASGHTTISVSNELLDKINSQTELLLHDTTGTTQRAGNSDPSLLGPG
jgi:hypothetical protein